MLLDLKVPITRLAKAMMDNAVRLEGAHYEIGLPWKCDEPSLPNNRTMAEKRLGYLKKRLERDPGLHSKYKATMEDYIAKRHAKIVQPNDLKTPEELSPRRPPWHDLVKKSLRYGKPGRTNSSRLAQLKSREATNHPN